MFRNQQVGSVYIFFATRILAETMQRQFREGGNGDLVGIFIANQKKVWKEERLL